MFRLRVCRKAAACTCRAGYGGRPGRRGAATTSRTEAGRRGQRHPQTGGRAPGSGPASDEGFAAADLRLIAGAVPRPAQSRPQPPPPGRGAAPAPAMSARLGCLPPTPQFSPVSQRASPAPTPWAGLLAVWRPHMGNEDRDSGDAQGSPARGWGSPCFRKAVLEAAAVHAARGQASIPAVSPASTPQPRRRQGALEPRLSPAQASGPLPDATPEALWQFQAQKVKELHFCHPARGF